jgi:TatD DNase family protein
LIDFHCHLDLFQEPERVIERVDHLGMYVLAVTTTPLTWKQTGLLCGKSRKIRVALGLHPELVAERFREVDLLCSLLPEARYVGEIGLDGSPPHRDSLPIQHEVLAQILQCCQTVGGRIMSIHSRGAAKEIIEMLRIYTGAGTPILHWFSGTKAELASAVEMGCWFSVGPAMLQGAKGRELAALMPRDRILTETDGPFTRIGTEPMFPWNVASALTGLAGIWGISRDDTLAMIDNNLRWLVSKPM